jgi:hypothetical protein
MFNEHPEWEVFFREPVEGEIEHLISLAGPKGRAAQKKLGAEPLVAVVKIDTMNAARIPIRRSAMPSILTGLSWGVCDID